MPGALRAWQEGSENGQFWVVLTDVACIGRFLAAGAVFVCAVGACFGRSVV